MRFKKPLPRVSQFEFAEHANTANTVLVTAGTPLAGHATETAHADVADVVEHVTTVTTATFANTANTVESVNSVGRAEHASFASHVEHATSVAQANSAPHANTADLATSANNLTYLATHPLSDFLLVGGLQIQLATVNLSTAQLGTLHATPVQVIAAPGAGNVVFVLSCTFTGSWSFNTIKDIGLQYGLNPNAGGQSLSGIGVTFGGNIDPTRQNTYYTLPPYQSFPTGLAAATLEDKAIAVANFVAIDGGVSGSFGGYVVVHVSYVVLSI